MLLAEVIVWTKTSPSTFRGWNNMHSTLYDGLRGRGKLRQHKAHGARTGRELARELMHVHGMGASMSPHNVSTCVLKMVLIIKSYLQEILLDGSNDNIFFNSWINFYNKSSPYCMVSGGQYIVTNIASKLFKHLGVTIIPRFLLKKPQILVFYGLIRGLRKWD